MHCDKCDIMIYFMYSKTGIDFLLEKIFIVLGLVYRFLKKPQIQSVQCILCASAHHWRHE